MDRTDQALSKVRGFIEKRDFAVDGRIPPERTPTRPNCASGAARCAERSKCSTRKGASIAIRDAEPSYILRRPIGPSRQHPMRRRTARRAASSRAFSATSLITPIRSRLSKCGSRLEPAMARLAALRASTAEIKRLQTLAGKTRAASTSEILSRGAPGCAAFGTIRRSRAQYAVSRVLRYHVRAAARRRLAPLGRARTLLQAPGGLRTLPADRSPRQSPPAMARKPARKCCAISATSSNTFLSRHFRDRKPLNRFCLRCNGSLSSTTSSWVRARPVIGHSQNRLTADPDVTVLLLEAGGWDRDPWIHIPLGWGKILQKRRLRDWGLVLRARRDGRRPAHRVRAR